MRFAEMTWPELRDAGRDTVVLAPFGACEQHGPFLPFATDALIVGALAERAEAVLNDEVLLLPTQWLGASQHHLPFGTLTADVETHQRLVRDTCDSVLQAGFRKVLVLNGHGGNSDTIRLALRQLDLRCPEATLASASYWSMASAEVAGILEGPLKSVGHACELETSAMLYLHPDLVREDLVCDDGIPLAEALRGISVTRSSREWGLVGAEGYASLATADKGRRLVEAMVARLIEVVRELRLTLPDGTRQPPAA